MSTAIRLRRSLRRAGLALALAVVIAPLPGVSHAGLVRTPVCAAHLAKADRALAATGRIELASADGAAAGDCAALHGRVRAMLELRNIYTRCTTGSVRDELLARTRALLENTTALLDAMCRPIRGFD